MECVYEQCPAKLEIDRLIEGHRDLHKAKSRYEDKFHMFEKHHSELMNQQTKISGDVAILTTKLELQQTDREEKHRETIRAIEILQSNLNNHTNDEMKKFEEIHNTFTTIKDSMDKIVLANNIISWKVIAIFTTISTTVGGFATYLWGILK